MPSTRTTWAALALRVALAAVLGGKAAALLVAVAHGAAGAPGAHLPLAALALIELAGAALLLAVPRWALGYVLLALSIVLASAFHLLHGETPSAAFLVYLASIALVATMRPARGYA